ncbi:MAG: glycosyltransferase family 2 protein [Candidatus Megaira endosymbiont of Mesostigma viride]|nr:MAG: glycosyltransferase family 2 protein [Candidatus Megaira endosymbiont of Mesostigma viride]HJK88641.1 glycosyltransferase family 2 protein [Candidatus Megaira endosymbiont of Mesostigma viride]
MIIEVSFIITVFNKAKYLPITIHSILRQTENLSCEYIFVDDASYDDSIKVIKQSFNSYQKLTILANKQNKGPACCLNQGCAVASGKYFFLIDADDILVKNSLKIMLDAIKKEHADFVFGGYKITNQEQKDLLNIQLTDNTDYQVSSTPLDTLLNGQYVRMSYLTTKELYLKSGGANDKIFIQDESLPLRLAYNAKKMLTMSHSAVYAGKNDNSLSKNKLQQIHDRFYAYYFALLEFTQLTISQKKEIYKRAISSVWKAKRLRKELIHRLFFIIYLKIKLIPINPNIKELSKYKYFIDNLKHVRKPL